MEGGPDACLGYLPGVTCACCGHGDEASAYVVFGARALPGSDYKRRPDLEGAAALAYFKEALNGTPAQ